MNAFFEQFGINPGLLIAQVINFGILVLVLYKFVYHPILNILDKRRDKIENSLKEAEAIEKRTAKIEEEVTAKLREAKKDAEKIIAEAKEIGVEARNELLVATNKEITIMMEKAKSDLERGKVKLMEDIEGYVVKTSVLIVNKLLADKLDSSTKEKLVNESLKEMAHA